MRNFLISFFSFSRKELNGILILLIFNTAILVLPDFYLPLKEKKVYDMSAFGQQAALFKASAVKKKRSVGNAGSKSPETGIQPEYFEFDPNGLSLDGWKRLGLSEAQIRVIHNYEAKGGRFYRKEDLSRIYSISRRQYADLEPFIHINPDRSPARGSVQEHPAAGVKYERESRIVELNNADSADLVGIRGIGPVFASRILRFRARLGGFYRREQLKEVYGIDSLKYQDLRDLVQADSSLIRKINMNTATFKELKTHPYLTYKQMNALIRYREQHGPYGSQADLRKVLILDEEIIRKIGPYLSFD